MVDTYEIAKNFAGSIFNKDVSAMLKLVSPSYSAMDELIRADLRRFADMPKLSVFDTFPKDLYPSIMAANYPGLNVTKDLRDAYRDQQPGWNVVPPPPAPIKVDVTINLETRTNPEV